METATAYKVFRIMDGVRCSNSIYTTKLRLIYPEGRWVRSHRAALAEGCGIYCFRSLEVAFDWGRYHPWVQGSQEIWKVEGIGIMPLHMKNPVEFRLLKRIRDIAELRDIDPTRLLSNFYIADSICFERIRLIEQVHSLKG